MLTKIINGVWNYYDTVTCSYFSEIKHMIIIYLF